MQNEPLTASNTHVLRNYGVGLENEMKGEGCTCIVESFQVCDQLSRNENHNIFLSAQLCQPKPEALLCN